MEHRTVAGPATLGHIFHYLLLRRRLSKQLAAFLCLELAFIVFALACLFAPIPSPSVPPTQAKAGLTILSIIWQTIATINAQNIILHGFSSEWYIRLQGTGKLTPGHTDLVSTITSGFRTCVGYFFSKTASPSYRASFMTSWVLTALAGLAPGVINVEDVPRFVPTVVNITNFTATGGDTDGPLKNPIVRAGFIVELEQQENSPFGLTTQGHIVVGWPNIEPGQIVADMEYDSDVLLYNMTCWWEAPSYNMSQWNTTWYAGGYAWYPWTTPLPNTTFYGGMMPMFRFSTDQEFFPNDFPDPLLASDSIGLSGYIFYGRNSSFPNVPKKRKSFNLDGLPSLYNPSGFHFIGYDGADGHFEPPLATFLLCDPHATLLDGRVLLTRGNASLTVLSTSSPVGGVPKIGNISPDAANVVLGLSMMDALECDDEAAKMRIGQLASKVFLNETSLNFHSTSSDPFDIGILPIGDIQQNLDRYMNSSAKALSTYIRDYDAEASDQLFLVPVSGTIQQTHSRLVASKSFLIATICLFVVAASGLITNLFYLGVWKMPGFKLETLIQCNQTQRQLDRKETFNSDSAKTSHNRDSKTLNLASRLFCFVVLEGAFLTLVFSCVKRPIFIHIPLSPTEVKGGFTVLSFLWQALAVLLLSEATSLAFSSEWSLQKAKTKLLIPGVTDRVSRLTSGNDDRVRYFFTRYPTITFRVAFLTSLLLISLNSFAPGALSVSKKKQYEDMPMDIADLRRLNSSQEDDNDNNLTFLEDRTSTLTMLERHEDAIFRYEVAPNWIMAWPDEASIGPNVAGNVEYPTDVVRYNYTCSWKKPTMHFDGDETVWIVGGQLWELWSEPLPNLPYVGGILPLYRYMDIQPDAMAAFLVIGTNASFSVDPNGDKRSILDLGHLPTLVHPSGIMLNISDSDPSQWISPLSTVLLCDPRIEISGGRAQLAQNKTLAATTSDLPTIGNLPYDAVTTIFTQAFLETLDSTDETDDQWVNLLSARLFLTDTSLNFTAFPFGVPIHDVETLSNNFNSFFLSASKAFLDGLYVTPSNESTIITNTRTVLGRAEVENEALVADKRLGIVSLCLSLGIVLCFGGLMRLMATDNGVPFELQYLLPEIDAYMDESYLILG